MFITMLAHLPVIIASIIIGILSQSANIIPLTSLTIILIFFLIFVAYLVTQNKYIRLACVAVISCMLGALFWQHQQQRQLCYEQLFSNYTLDVIGTVIDKQILENKFQYVLNIHAFHTTLNHNWQNINTCIVVQDSSHQKLEIGDQITISKLTCAPQTSSLSIWLKKHNYSAFAFYVPNITVTKHSVFSVQNWLWRTREHFVHQIKLKLSPQAHGLFTSIFLGNPEKNNPYAYHESFSWWGLNHYLARAGLHLVILFLILNLLITIITSRFITKTFINMAISTFYYLLTWQNIPFVRAFLVLITSQCCHLFKVPINTLHLLNLIIIFYLLFNPQALFFLDFQLTFVITYTLILIGRSAKFFTYS